MDNSKDLLQIPTNLQSLPASQRKESLSTKIAIELLLNGKMKESICKFCLCVDSSLYFFDQIFEIITYRGSFSKVTLNDMIGTIYPFQISKDPNIPNRVCNKCVDKIISSYLFAQQCDQAERALNNCIEDIYNKIEKLDPLDRSAKRGRQKLNPNTNIINAEFEFVIDYAKPLMCLITHNNIESKEEIGELECKKCWKVFSNSEQLLNHEILHPKSMWYSCRICGLAFPKITAFKKHIKGAHKPKIHKPVESKIVCTCDCGNETKNYSEHLQHVQKHKFKDILQHALHGKMGQLCSVCLEKKSNMNLLTTNLRLHGGYPEISGNHKLSNIVSKVLPERNQHNASKFRPLPFTNVAEMMKLKLKAIKKKSEVVVDSSVKEKSDEIRIVEDLNNKSNVKEDCVYKGDLKFANPDDLMSFLKIENYQINQNIENNIQTNENREQTSGNERNLNQSLCVRCNNLEKINETETVEHNVVDESNNIFKIGEKRILNSTSLDDQTVCLPKKRKVDMIENKENEAKDSKIKSTGAIYIDSNLKNTTDMPVIEDKVKDDKAFKSLVNENTDTNSQINKTDGETYDHNVSISLNNFQNIRDEPAQSKDNEQITEGFQGTVTENNNYVFKEKTEMFSKVEKEESYKKKEQIVETPLNVTFSAKPTQTDPIDEVTISQQNLFIPIAPVLKKNEVHTGTQTEKLYETEPAVIPIVETPKQTHFQSQPQNFLHNLDSFNVQTMQPLVGIEEMDIDEFATHNVFKVDSTMDTNTNLVHNFGLPNITIVKTVEPPKTQNISQNWVPPPVPNLQFSIGSTDVKKDNPQKNRRFIKAKRRHN